MATPQTTPKLKGCTKEIFTGARWDFGGHKCSLYALEGTDFCKRHQPDVEIARRRKKAEEFNISFDRETKAYEVLHRLLAQATEEERQALRGFSAFLRKEA